MENHVEKMKLLLEALAKIESSNRNELQNNLLQEAKTKIGGVNYVNTLLHNKNLYNGVGEFSAMGSIDLDKKDWGEIDTSSIDLGDDWIK